MNKDLHCSNIYHLFHYLSFISKIYVSIIQTVDYVNNFKYIVLSHFVGIYSSKQMKIPTIYRLCRY